MKSLQRLLRWWWIFAVAAIVIAITYIYIGIKGNSPIHLEVERNTRIDLTPEQILSVRDIGQWEFLTINTEELVEWQRSRTLTTDRLTRIYQGTLRLGIDMSKASDDWFTSLPDSTAQLILISVLRGSSQSLDTFDNLLLTLQVLLLLSLKCFGRLIAHLTNER